MASGGEVVANWQLPTRRAAAWFRLRVACHVMWRGLRNLCSPAVRRHLASDQLKHAPVIAERRTALWLDGRDDEFALVAGKVHNLRIARPVFDGIVVPAGSVFSFWRQLGRPSRLRGFVEGREVQAGCVVPTIAGGLCQLSNALASCAAEAGITLVERHGHTARVERSAAPEVSGSVDATVFWNYVDLRLAASFDFRIDVELGADELVVRFRAADPVRAIADMPAAGMPIHSGPIAMVVPIAADRSGKPVARGCLTCDETSCFRHRPQAPRRAGGSTAVLVNAWTPEFAQHLKGLAPEADWFVPWVRPARQSGGAWTPPSSQRHTVALLASLRRTMHLRRHAGDGGERQAAVLQGSRWIAEHFARRLEPHHTHLVIDQDLLVPLAQSGALGGRTYEVLVHAMPAQELQRRLDAAASCWPGAASLTDFRVSEAFGAMELEALRRAQRLVTPHADLARYLQNALDETTVQGVDWVLPPPTPVTRPARPGGIPTVVFPASALARKGAHELAQALRALGWRLLVLGSPSSDPQLWHGIDVTHLPYRDPAWLARADVVALPAHVEHSPRGLLAAIAHGLPVVASPACGLPRSLKAIEVTAGDVPGLIAALKQALRLKPADPQAEPTPCPSTARPTNAHRDRPGRGCT